MSESLPLTPGVERKPNVLDVSRKDPNCRTIDVAAIVKVVSKLVLGSLSKSSVVDDGQLKDKAF
jgi:hypothetical protein